MWSLQGGKPSPFDRNLSTKLAAKAVEKLIQQIEDSKTPDGIKLVVIYVKYMNVIFTTVDQSVHL